MPLATEDLLIYHRLHGHHRACGLLLSLVVGLILAWHVTVGAIHAERIRNELHGGAQLVGGSSLELDDVVVHLLGDLAPRGLRICGVWRERDGFGGYGKSRGSDHPKSG